MEDYLSKIQKLKNEMDKNINESLKLRKKLEKLEQTYNQVILTQEKNNRDNHFNIELLRSAIKQYLNTDPEFKKITPKTLLSIDDQKVQLGKVFYLCRKFKNKQLNNNLTIKNIDQITKLFEEFNIPLPPVKRGRKPIIKTNDTVVKKLKQIPKTKISNIQLANKRIDLIKQAISKYLEIDPKFTNINNSTIIKIENKNIRLGTLYIQCRKAKNNQTNNNTTKNTDIQAYIQLFEKLNIPLPPVKRGRPTTSTIQSETKKADTVPNITTQNTTKNEIPEFIINRKNKDYVSLKKQFLSNKFIHSTIIYIEQNPEAISIPYEAVVQLEKGKYGIGITLKDINTYLLKHIVPAGKTEEQIKNQIISLNQIGVNSTFQKNIPIIKTNDTVVKKLKQIPKTKISNIQPVNKRIDLIKQAISKYLEIDPKFTNINNSTIIKIENKNIRLGTLYIQCRKAKNNQTNNNTTKNTDIQAYIQLFEKLNIPLPPVKRGRPTTSTIQSETKKADTVPNITTQDKKQSTPIKSTSKKSVSTQKQKIPEYIKQIMNMTSNELEQLIQAFEEANPAVLKIWPKKTFNYQGKEYAIGQINMDVINYFNSDQKARNIKPGYTKQLLESLKIALENHDFSVSNIGDIPQYLLSNSTRSTYHPPKTIQTSKKNNIQPTSTTKEEPNILLNFPLTRIKVLSPENLDEINKLCKEYKEYYDCQVVFHKNPRYDQQKYTSLPDLYMICLHYKTNKPLLNKNWEKIDIQHVINIFENNGLKIPSTSTEYGNMVSNYSTSTHRDCLNIKNPNNTQTNQNTQTHLDLSKIYQAIDDYHKLQPNAKYILKLRSQNDIPIGKYFHICCNYISRGDISKIYYENEIQQLTEKFELSGFSFPQKPAPLIKRV